MVNTSSPFGVSAVNLFRVNPDNPLASTKSTKMPKDNLNNMLGRVFQRGGVFSTGQGSTSSAKKVGSELGSLYSGMGLGSVLSGILGSEKSMEKTLGGILSTSFGGTPTATSSGVIEGLLQGGAGMPANGDASSLLGSFKNDVKQGGGLFGVVKRQTGKSDTLIPSLQSTPFGKQSLFGGIEGTLRTLMQSLH